MPSYEVAVIIKKLVERAALKSAVSTTCNRIYVHGGVIRKMENLGYRELPQPIRSQQKKHTAGNYFAIHFDSSVESMKKIAEDYRNTKQIIHFGVIRTQEEPRRPCLDGPCLFGELPNPEHEKTAYMKSVLGKLKNRRISNV